MVIRWIDKFRRTYDIRTGIRSRKGNTGNKPCILSQIKDNNRTYYTFQDLLHSHRGATKKTKSKWEGLVYVFKYVNATITFANWFLFEPYRRMVNINKNLNVHAVAKF